MYLNTSQVPGMKIVPDNLYVALMENNSFSNYLMKLKRNLGTHIGNVFRNPITSFPFLHSLPHDSIVEFFKAISSQREAMSTASFPYEADTIPDLRGLQKAIAFKGIHGCKYQTIIEAAALKLKIWNYNKADPKGKKYNLLNSWSEIFGEYRVETL